MEISWFPKAKPVAFYNREDRILKLKKTIINAADGRRPGCRRARRAVQGPSRIKIRSLFFYHFPCISVATMPAIRRHRHRQRLRGICHRRDFAATRAQPSAGGTRSGDDRRLQESRRRRPSDAAKAWRARSCFLCADCQSALVAARREITERTRRGAPLLFWRWGGGPGRYSRRNFAALWTRETSAKEKKLTLRKGVHLMKGMCASIDWNIVCSCNATPTIVIVGAGVGFIIVIGFGRICWG